MKGQELQNSKHYKILKKLEPHKKIFLEPERFKEDVYKIVGEMNRFFILYGIEFEIKRNKK